MEWLPGGETDLAWITSAAVEADRCGFDVGPLPDAALVLNPIFARHDGAVMDTDAFNSWTSGPLPPDLRRVRWSEYAENHNVPMFAPGRGAGMYSLPGIWTDAHVAPPLGGDTKEWNAIFDLLIAHSRNGAETLCTAFFDPFWQYEPSTGTERPHVLRGRLGDHHMLEESDDYADPQNVWPDDREWVLFTHTDAWATQISGSTALIDALIASPILETVRLANLP